MKNRSGFTVLELVLTVGMIAIIFLVGLEAFSSNQRASGLQEGGTLTIDALSTASEYARIGKYGSPWGVYLDYDEATREVAGLTIFSGESYALRDITYDIVYPITSSVMYSYVSLSGVGPSFGNDHEVVFGLFDGETPEFGAITVNFLESSMIIDISPQGFTSHR